MGINKVRPVRIEFSEEGVVPEVQVRAGRVTRDHLATVTRDQVTAINRATTAAEVIPRRAVTATAQQASHTTPIISRAASKK